MAETPVIHFKLDDLPAVKERPSEEFQRVRSAVVGVLRQFGSVGPDDSSYVPGQLELNSKEEEPPYYVVPFPVEPLVTCISLEPIGKSVSEELLRSVMQALREFPGWTVGIACGTGYLIVDSD